MVVVDEGKGGSLPGGRALVGRFTVKHGDVLLLRLVTPISEPIPTLLCKLAIRPIVHLSVLLHDIQDRIPCPSLPLAVACTFCMSHSVSPPYSYPVATSLSGGAPGPVKRVEDTRACGSNLLGAQGT
jgi:hypothetical protein